MNPLLYTDSYKLAHYRFMNDGTSFIYSNLTPRSDKHFPEALKEEPVKVVTFGIQYFIKEFLIEKFNNEFFNQPINVVKDMVSLIGNYLGENVDVNHFYDLHQLGYLPIEIKSLPEGSLSPIGIPVLTIENTHPDYAWLTNYLESVMSSEIWKPVTVATKMYAWRNKIIKDSGGSFEDTMFHLHDFSSRGMSGRHDSAICGSAFMLSSHGTDTVAAVKLISDYYNTDLSNYFLATSVPASEHMIACLGTAIDGELESYRKWITQDYPSGIVALVSDAFDYWKVLTEYLPALEDEVLSRTEDSNGLCKVVIRPDSGDPADIICGKRLIGIGCHDSDILSIVNAIQQGTDIATKSYSYKGEDSAYEYFYYTNDNNEFRRLLVSKYAYGVWYTDDKVIPADKGSIALLWETFGGTTDDEGIRTLNSKIGLIYGDSMTPEIVQEIMLRLKENKFNPLSCIFGVGSYSLNYLTRDTLGMAIKCTHAVNNGVGLDLYKDPITDGGVKKSAKGLLSVVRDDNGEMVLIQQASKEDMDKSLLRSVFKDGELLVDESFEVIRNRLWSKNDN